MNARIKARWLKALRSGKYRQGTGHLKKTTITGEARHCCLGVLCELAMRSKVIAPSVAAHDGISRIHQFDGNTGFLPLSVIEWAGLTDYDPDVSTKQGLATCLSHLNDSGKSFKQIANIIEQQL